MPVLETVTVCGALVVPVGWLAKVRLVALRLATGTGATPVPLRGTLTGPAGSSLATTSEPAAAPPAVGAKVTLTEQVGPPGTSEAPRQGDAAESTAMNGAGAVTELMVWATPPLLAMVTICAALVVPVVWGAKVRLAGAEPIAGASWPFTTNRLVCTHSAAKKGTPQLLTEGLGLMVTPGGA